MSEDTKQFAMCTAGVVAVAFLLCIVCLRGCEQCEMTNRVKAQNARFVTNTTVTLEAPR